MLLSTILASGLAAPGLAQTPREHRNLDANGVDLTHGDAIVSVVEGSIGNGDGELPLVRNQIAPGDGAQHVGYGAHQWDGIFLQRSPVSGGGVTTGIIKDMRFENFPANSTLPTGSTLSGSGQEYLYQMSDGTSIVFSDPAGHTYGNSTFCNGSDGQTYCVLAPSSITTPDGKTTSIAYDLWGGCESPQMPDEPFACTYWTRIASVSNNSGYRISFTYASQGSGSGTAPPPNSWQRRTSATFHNDNAGGAAVASTSYSYPSAGVVDITDTAGQVWKLTGDYLKVTAIRRPGASSDTTSIAYSGNQVTSVTRDGVTTGYARSVTGSTATMTVTNALSQQSTIVSNLTLGRPTSVTDALSRTTAYQYDGSNRLNQITWPEGNKAVLVYDARGNVTSTTLKAKTGSGLADIVTTAGYPSACSNPVTCNSPEWTKDAKGNQTDYTYDATHGGVLTVTAPADVNGIRPQTRYSYTLTNGVYLLTGTSTCMASASCTDAASEVKSTIGYNSNLLPATIMRAAGDGSTSSTITATYDALGDVKTVDGPLPGSADTVTYRHAAGRRLAGVVGPDPDGGGARKTTAQRLTYNALGQVTLAETGTVDDASDTAWAAFSSQDQVATTYDTNTRAVRSDLKSGSTTYAVSQASHDALGRVECTVSRMNPAVFASLPSSACSLGTQGSGAGDFGPDRIAKTTYDAAGQVTKVQTAYGTTQQADEVTAAYTTNGQLDYVIDAELNRTEYAYDGHDRLVKTEYPSATKGANAANASDYEQLAYDPNGNATSRRLRNGATIAYAYDDLNRLTLVDAPGGYDDIRFGHDLLGRMTTACNNDSGSACASGGWSVTRSFDALSRLTSEAAGVGSGATTLAYQYDAAGRRTRLTHPDGFYVSYDHDVTGNVTHIRENGASSGVGVLATYAYDNLGRQSSVTYGNGMVQSYNFDPVSRLQTLTSNLAGTSYDQTATFGYNPASQIDTLSKSNDAYAWGNHYNIDRVSAGNGLNQLKPATPGGGQVSVPSLSYDAKGNSSGIGSSSYQYDIYNQLASGTIGGVTTGLNYDGLGRMRSISPPTNILQFQNDGAVLAIEYSYPLLGIARRYVHGPGTDAPIVAYEGSGTSNRRFLTADERGSIVSVTDSSGAVVATNTYDEYGNPGSGNASISNGGRFGYTGQAWLPEIGMWYYKARIYNPALGRFMQTDPIGYADGMNWYNYVGSDPVNFTDPTGRKCNDPRDPDAYCDPNNPELDGPEIVASGNRGSGGSGGANIWARGGSGAGGEGNGGGIPCISGLNCLVEWPEPETLENQCNFANNFCGDVPTTPLRPRPKPTRNKNSELICSNPTGRCTLVVDGKAVIPTLKELSCSVALSTLPYSFPVRTAGEALLAAAGVYGAADSCL